MAVLATQVDPRSEAYRTNHAAMAAQVRFLDEQLALARAGGGEKYVTRHRQRGKLLARERIELLVDRDSPFLELSPLAAWGTEYALGANVVTGVGVVSGVECVITANDPTMKGGAINPITLAKTVARDGDRRDESDAGHQPDRIGRRRPARAGEDLRPAADAQFRELTRRSAERIPTICLVFGSSTAGGAYIPGMSRLRRHGEGRREGVPRRAAAGEDGDQRGDRRRVARRRRDAQPRLRRVRLPRRGRARRHPHRPRDRRAPQLAEARHGPHAGARGAALRPRRAARHRLGRRPQALRGARDHRAYRRRLALRGVQDPRTGRRSSPAGRISTATRSASSATTASSSPTRRRRRRSSSSSATRSTCRSSSCRTSPATWSASSTSSGGIIKDGAKMINAVSNSTVPMFTVMIGS